MSCTASASMLVIASVPLMSASPSLGSTSMGVSPLVRSASAPSTRPTAGIDHPSLTEQHRGDRRKRRQVARCPEGAVLGHPGHDARRRAGRGAPRPVRRGRRTGRRRGSAPGAGSFPRTTSSSRPAPDPAAWLSTTDRWSSARSAGIDGAVGQRSEAGGNAIDDGSLAIETVDDRSRRPHPARGRRDPGPRLRALGLREPRHRWSARRRPQ